MLVLFPVHVSDHQQAIKTLELSAELGFQEKHNLIIFCAPDSTVIIDKVLDAGRKAFKHVQFIQIESEVPKGWPKGPNAMFYEAIAFLQRPLDADRQLANAQYPHGIQHMDFPEQNGHFLWWEPDAAPLHRNWLDRLESAYLAGQKPYCGCKAQTYQTTLDATTRAVIKREPSGWHMVGVGIYPRAFPTLVQWWKAVRDDETPFDVLFQNEICHRLSDGSFSQMFECGHFTHNSRSSNYRIVKNDIGETYVHSDPNPEFPNGSTKFLWTHDGSYGALLAHGCKDDSIYAVVRQLNGLEAARESHVVGRDNEGNPVAISLGPDGLKLIPAATEAKTASVQSSAFADTTEDDEEYQEYLAWKRHKNREAKKENAAAKPKHTPTEEEITEYYKEYGWRKTLAHFKISPKVLKPIKDSLS